MTVDPSFSLPVIRKRYPHFAILILFLCLVLTGLFPFVAASDAAFTRLYNSVLMPLLNFGATLLLVLAAVRTYRVSKALGRAWFFLAAGQFFYFAGDVLFSVLDVVLEKSPFPSVADVFFMLYYPFFLAGIFMMPGGRGQNWERLYDRLQAAVVMLSASLFMWYFIVSPLIVQTGSHDLWLLVLSTAMPAVDLLLLLAGVVLIFRRNMRGYPVALFLLTLGVLLTVVLDTLFSYQSLKGAYTTGSWLDFGYEMSYVLIGMAALGQALNPSEQTLQMGGTSGQIRIARTMSLVRTLLPNLWLVAVFLLLAVSPYLPGSMSHIGQTAWTAAILVLLVLQQVVAANENVRLNQNLRHLNEDLEARVEDRTRALESSNRDLTQEIHYREQITEQLRVSRHLYRTVVEDLPVFICRFQPGGLLTFVNQAYCNYFQKSREELIGTSFFELIPEVDREWVAQKYQGLSRNNPVTRYEHRVLAPGGAIRWQRWVDRAVFDGDELVEYQSIGEDTTEQHLAVQALRESEEKFRDLFDNSTDLIQLISPDGQIIFVNNAWKKKLGYGDEDLGQISVWDLLDPGCHDQCQTTFARVLTGEQLDSMQTVFINRAGEPVYLEGNLNCSINNGVPEYIRCIFHDITERRKSEHLLIQQAYHDTLTRLPNRAMLVNRLRQAIQRAGEGGCEQCALLFLDLDNFKVVNDSLGHTTGDALLVAAGERLASCVRSQDLVARLGGDEFVILLEGLVSDGYAVNVAERVGEALSQPILLGTNPVSLSVSIGIVMGEHIQDPEGALRDADIAMYNAKATGKDRYAVFEPDMRVKPAERLALQNDLRAAMEREELFLVYQPVFQLETRQVRGMEALLRWRHPQRGLVNPTEFIPVAEETGLILPLGAWVLRQACRQRKAWLEICPEVDLGVMSVNVSIKQLIHPSFLADLRQTLVEVDLQPGCLALELTEGVVMENIRQAGEILEEIHRLGIQIYIDDFGTGYSSLERLQHLPIQIIKIDRNFLAQLREDGSNAEVLRAIVVLGHELGLKIIAEGIEKSYQADYLHQLGCTLGQGFMLSVPLTAGELQARFGLPEHQVGAVTQPDQA